MHPKHIRKYALKRLITPIILLVIMLAAYLFSTQILTGNEEYKHKIKEDLQALNTSSSEVQNKLNISKTALIAWNETIKKKYAQREGLRIRQAQLVLDKLKKTYKVANTAIKFSKAERRKDIESKFVDIEYSIGDLSFDAITDLEAMMFIEDFLDKMPGVLILKKINLTSAEQLNSSVIQDLSGGGKKGLITVKIDFLWQDMVDKTYNDSNDDANKVVKK